MKSCLFYFLLLLLPLAGCKKERPGPGGDGISGPVIKVVSQSEATSSGMVCGTEYDNVLYLRAGTVLELVLQLQSNRELSQYRIEAHSNFDCHSHGRVAATEPWTLQRTVDLSGTDTIVTELLQIPAEASAGNYHLMIRLLDEGGQEAAFREYNVILTQEGDTEPPVLALVRPAEDRLTAAPGSVLVFEGTVTDNNPLYPGKLEISYTDAKGAPWRIKRLYFPEDAAEAHFLEEYTLPAYIEKGDAVFYIRAYDAVNNEVVKTLTVHIP